MGKEIGRAAQPICWGVFWFATVVATSVKGGDRLKVPCQESELFYEIFVPSFDVSRALVGRDHNVSGSCIGRIGRHPDAVTWRGAG